MPTATYQHDSQTVVDTELRLEDGSASHMNDDNTTGRVGVFEDRGSEMIARLIYDFDTSGLSKDVSVTSATIRLYCTAGALGSSAFELIGGSEVFNTTGDFPTWAHKADGVAWATAGGSAVGPTVTTTTPSLGILSKDITSIVRWCLDNTENRHVIVVHKHGDETETDDEVAFVATSDNATSGNRPKLTINYQRGKGAMGQAVFYSGSRRRRNRRSGRKH